MDLLGSRESDLDFDLESGETETTSEEDGGEESSSESKQSKKKFCRARSGYLCIGESIAGSHGLGARRNTSSVGGENMDMLVSSSKGKVAVGGMEKTIGEKQNKKITKKHPKPPRPPTGPPLLHAADMELVKEISKRARLRQARKGRIKALKKMKSDKTSSPKINVLAMVVTSVFFFVIIFQGILGARV